MNAGYERADANDRLQQLAEIIDFPILSGRHLTAWVAAITHPSYPGVTRRGNEGLARLGDLAMRTVQTALLLRGNEGDDGGHHRTIVQGHLAAAPLIEACRLSGLDRLAYFRGIERLPDRGCADLIQAILGAVYLDAESEGKNVMEKVQHVMDRLHILYVPSSLRISPPALTSNHPPYFDPSQRYYGAAYPQYTYESPS